jgi:hypothetical protein
LYPSRSRDDIIWYGSFIPAEQRWNAQIVDGLRDIGQEPFPPDQCSAAAAAAFEQAEADKWWPIIKAANLQGE